MASRTLSSMAFKKPCNSQILLSNAPRPSSSSQSPLLFFLAHSYPFKSCQCGISRSATLVIALVMRAAAENSPSVPPEVWALKGMQEAYAFVKEKSPCVGPNMQYVHFVLLSPFFITFLQPHISTFGIREKVEGCFAPKLGTVFRHRRGGGGMGSPPPHVG